jgi:hypothetical protein
MALSGSYNWTLNRDQVITGALRKLGVLASGNSPTTEQTNDASEALNALVKAFQADGMPLWAITSHTWTVTSGTSSYVIGIGQTLNTVAPLRVIQAFYIVEDTAQVPMNVYNRYDFNQLPVNGTQISGVPVNLYYQPTVPATDYSGTIKLWPVPNDSTTQITIHYTRPFQDMDGATDNFDFPSYWIQALISNLAWVMAGEYGVPPNDRAILAQEAQFWKTEALSIGSEEGSVFMQPYKQGN